MIETNDSKRISESPKKLFTNGLICFCLVISSFLSQHALSQEMTNPLSLAQIAALRKKLDAPCAQSKENVAFRAAIQDLEDAFKITIWIDRRVDLDCLVSLKAEKQSLEKSIDALAEELKASVAWIDRILYIAPRDHVDRIESSYWTLFRALPEADRRKKLSLKWPELTVASQPILAFAESTGRRVEGLDTIEYDLWRAKSLDECNEAAIWTALLAGFDRTLVLNESSGSFVVRPIENNGLVIQEYGPKQIDPKRWTSWKKDWPDAKVQKNKSGNWMVQAAPRSHRELFMPTRYDAKSKSRSNDESLDKKRFTSSSMKGRLQDILTYLREKNDLEIEPWPLPGNWSDRPLDLSFRDLSIDELLEKISNAASLQIVREDHVLRISER